MAVLIGDLSDRRTIFRIVVSPDDRLSTGNFEENLLLASFV
jgi:hypothetical protein